MSLAEGLTAGGVVVAFAAAVIAFVQAISARRRAKDANDIAKSALSIAELTARRQVERNDVRWRGTLGCTRQGEWQFTLEQRGLDEAEQVSVVVEVDEFRHEAALEHMGKGDVLKVGFPELEAFVRYLTGRADDRSLRGIFSGKPVHADMSARVLWKTPLGASRRAEIAKREVDLEHDQVMDLPGD